MAALVLDKSDYDVLNVITLKKMAAAPAVALACPSVADVPAVLAGLAERGLVVMAGDAALPTDAAEPALAAGAAHHYAGVRADSDIDGFVERFEAVNAQFLQAMSAWQQVDIAGRKVANDHTDSAYDGKVIGRLERLVDRLAGLLDALAGHDPRFADYGRRFSDALAAVDAGRHELVSSPTADSVHNIWFEFHEDLLRTLGRERTE